MIVFWLQKNESTPFEYLCGSALVCVSPRVAHGTYDRPYLLGKTMSLGQAGRVVFSHSLARRCASVHDTLLT